jgi:hypothetical protein
MQKLLALIMADIIVTANKCMKCTVLLETQYAQPGYLLSFSLDAAAINNSGSVTWKVCFQCHICCQWTGLEIQTIGNVDFLEN